MKFKEVQKNIISYLSSEEFKSREDAQTTNTDLLIEINKLGFITENSQEGVIQKGYNKETKLSYEIHERAYVTGFMLKDKALDFVNKINNSNKVAFIVSECSDEKYIYVSISKNSKTNEFKGDTKLYTSLSSEIINAIKKDMKLNKSENIEFICCFDPVYGRKASSKYGLYKTIIDSLKA